MCELRKQLHHVNQQRKTFEFYLVTKQYAVELKLKFEYLKVEYILELKYLIFKNGIKYSKQFPVNKTHICVCERESNDLTSLKAMT